MNKKIVVFSAIIGGLLVLASSGYMPTIGKTDSPIDKPHTSVSETSDSAHPNKQSSSYTYPIELASLEQQYYYIYTEIPEPDLSISEKNLYNLRTQFNNALAYFKTHVERLTSFWFWNNYSFEDRPAVALLDDEFKIIYLLPFKQRKFEESTEPAKQDYSDIVCLISQNRKYINFCNLYNHFKPAIHSLIDKKTYDEKYADMVKRLLIAYNDMDTDEKYEKVNTIMLSHFEKSLRRNNKCEYCYTEDLAFFYDQLKPIISADAMEKLQQIPYPVEHGDDGSYMGEYATMWAYSFWNRRKLEDNKDDIYMLLTTIDNDYSKMR